MFAKINQITTVFSNLNDPILRKLLLTSPEGPLNGVMVVEIGQHVSGPMVGERLARKGAFVIKIEQPNIGDPARHYLSKEIFSSLNASKLSIAIGKEDSKLYQDILSMADVIVDNRSPKAKEQDNVLRVFLNLSEKFHPVIFCSIIGYQGEENKHLLALDVSVQAQTGMASVNGPKPGESLKVGFVVLDEATAMEASELIVTHLFSLSRGKKVPDVSNVIRLEVSMAHVSAYLMTGQYLNCIKQNKEPSRYGNRDNWLAPFSFYETADDMISLAIVSEDQYKRLCLDVLDDRTLFEQYQTNEMRMKHIDNFQKALQNILTKNSTKYWLDKCIQHNVPAGNINTMLEALKQPFAKNFFTQTRDGTLIIANPYTSSLYCENQLNDAPSLDEHRKPIQFLIERFHSMKQTSGVISFQALQATIIKADEDSKEQELEHSICHSKL